MADQTTYEQRLCSMLQRAHTGYRPGDAAVLRDMIGAVEKDEYHLLPGLLTYLSSSFMAVLDPPPRSRQDDQ